MDFTDEFERSLLKAMPVELQQEYKDWEKVNIQKTPRDFLNEKRKTRTKFDGDLEKDPIYKAMDLLTQCRCRNWIAKNNGTPQDFLHEYQIARNRANTKPSETTMLADGTIVPLNGMSQEDAHLMNLENAKTLRETGSEQ